MSLACREWTFVRRRLAPSARDESEAFRLRLLAALAAGRGTGVRFTLRVRSGPEPLLRLRPDTRGTERWIARSLVPAYDRYAWRAGPTDANVPRSDELEARRLRPWPDPLRPSTGGSTLIDSWLQTLSGLPPGLEIAVEFQPLPTRVISWWSGLARRPEANPVVVGPRRGTPPFAQRPTAAASESNAILAPPGWRVRIRLTLCGSEIARSSLVGFGRMLGTASLSDSGNGFGFVRRIGIPSGAQRASLLSESELGTFFPALDSLGAVMDAPDPWGAASLPLGRTEAGSVVRIPFESEQGRHLAVLGESGMGKSSLVVALARRVSRSHSVIVLDPLGTTARLIDCELPDEVRGRLLRIGPVAAPLRLNALDGIGAPGGPDPVRSERRLSDVVHSLRRVRSGRYTDSSYWGPRLEEVLTRALAAAAAWPGGTLEDAHLLLATQGRLHREVPPSALGPVQELARRIRERPEDAEGARRLLHEIVRNSVLVRMLCAPNPDLDPAELVRPGRVVLVSGDAPRVGESTARYLLSVYLAIIWSEVLARPGRSKIFLILDEAQWFAHESLAEMLRLGRFANLHVVLATQSLASLPETVRESVWTNVADVVAFRGSPEEARELARVSRGLTPDAILSLPRGHAIAFLGKGHSVRWLRTLRRPPGTPPPPEGLGAARADPGEPSDPPGEDAVLCYLRARAAGLSATEPLRVSLAELRSAVDPTGSAIRLVGSRLASAGALLASDHAGGGTVWTIAPERIPPPPSTGPPQDGPDGSSTPQPS